MDLFETVKGILNDGEKFTKSKNFYFEKHQCSKIDETVKVEMSYVIHKEQDDDSVDFIRFGMCPHCKEVFYYKDHTWKSFSGNIKF